MASEARKMIAATARSMIGWGYIYGATGWICTAARVEQQAKQYPDYADLIRKYGLGKWLGKHCVDCAQLTRLSAKAAGLTLPSGATSQWKADLWAEKGPIATLPEDSEGLFLYRQNGTVMQHTGICLGDGTAAEARGHAYGVIVSQLSDYPWTHWARADESGATGTNEAGSTDDGEGETTMSTLAGNLCTVANLKDGTTKLNVRATASTGAAKVAVISAGAQVTCLTDDGTWAKITTDSGVTGYCLSKYLTAVSATDTSDATRLTLLEARVATLELKVLGESQADG